jgi:hypothetical protein
LASHAPASTPARPLRSDLAYWITGESLLCSRAAQAPKWAESTETFCLQFSKDLEALFFSSFEKIGNERGENGISRESFRMMPL